VRPVTGTLTAATVTGRLSRFDRMLPVWIAVSMVAGLVVGRMVPGLGDALGAVEVDGISLPIGAGRAEPGQIAEAVRAAVSRQHHIRIADLRLVAAGTIPAPRVASLPAVPAGPNISRGGSTDDRRSLTHQPGPDSS
jgi:hypothetical protein